ncbi:MAG TPA: hypothetical protein VFP39_15460 [Gemmatimonadales bacterium]|nr:hypothetical protein [Gemmatimonadales bacterium]
MTVRVTRRQFLECSAAVAVPLRWRLGRGFSPVLGAKEQRVLDLGPHCSLRDSLAGYAAAMEGRAQETDVSSLAPCAVLIVPAAVEIPPAAVRAITASLEAGGLVILESGAGFASARDRSRHRAVLHDAFQVRIESPVDLWPEANGSAIPYVDYSWPVAAKVRDFSRVVPLARGAGEIIARVNGLPVALRLRCGRGTLIVLGSPLGPALWAGDAQARLWLRAVVKATAGLG